MDKLPMVLLSIRTTWKENIGCSAVECVYGMDLNLTGEFFTSSSSELPDTSGFLQHLRETMHNILPPLPEYHCHSQVFNLNNLATTGYVYLYKVSHGKTLHAPTQDHTKLLGLKRSIFSWMSIMSMKVAYKAEHQGEKKTTHPFHYPITFSDAIHCQVNFCLSEFICHSLGRVL